MQTLIDHFEMLDTHRHIIRKVSQRFRNKSAKRHKNGGTLIELGGVPSIWAHLEYSRKGIASGGSNLAHLGELGGNHLPHFLIKWHEGAEF